MVTVRGRVIVGVGEAAGVCACVGTNTNAIKLSMTGNMTRVFIINLDSK